MILARLMAFQAPKRFPPLRPFRTAEDLSPMVLSTFDPSSLIFSDNNPNAFDSTAAYGSEWLTPHFCREEFCFGCCEGRYCNGFPAEMEIEPRVLLEQLRNYFNRPPTSPLGYVRSATRRLAVLKTPAIWSEQPPTATSLESPFMIGRCCRTNRAWSNYL